LPPWPGGVKAGTDLLQTQLHRHRQRVVLHRSSPMPRGGHAALSRQVAGGRVLPRQFAQVVVRVLRRRCPCSTIGAPSPSRGSGSGEEVIVAGGGFVVGDDGPAIEGEGAEAVDAAAHAAALAASFSLAAAFGLVVRNRAASDGDRG